MENTIFYLIGPPGVGKYTVGQIIAARTGAKLVDNHTWNNVIFGLIEQDGVTPLPQSVWGLTGRVRLAVLDTIATLSPPSWSFIFTHAAVPDDPAEHDIARQIRSVAERRNAAMIVARLSCAAEQLALRVVGVGRRERMKETDPHAARRNGRLPVFDPCYPNSIAIDTTPLSAEQTAEQIMAAPRALPRQAQKR
jgi:hypothetical protein